MPSINDLIRGKNNKSSKGKNAKESKFVPSPGNIKSKIRSKRGLPPGFSGMVRSEGCVMLIKVDAKGRERVVSYIPEE